MGVLTDLAGLGAFGEAAQAFAGGGGAAGSGRKKKRSEPQYDDRVKGSGPIPGAEAMNDPAYEPGKRNGKRGNGNGRSFAL